MELRTLTMIKYIISAVVLSLLLSITLMLIFKSMGSYVAIGSGLITGWVLAYWFARSEKREPSSSETWLLIGTYGAIMALILAALFFRNGTPSGSGWIRLAMLVFAYPTFVSMVFNRKRIAKLIQSHEAKAQNS